MFPQFFISLLVIFILLLAAGILGAVEEQKVKAGGDVDLGSAEGGSSLMLLFLFVL